MIHLNSEMRKSPILFLAEAVMPETYTATTVDDFLREKDEVKATRRILPLGVYFNGNAIISFPSVSYKIVSHVRGILYKGIIYDLTASLDVELDPRFMEQELKDNLNNGMRLYNARVRYDLSDAALYLFYYEPSGPPISDEKDAKESIFDRLSIFSTS
jgi:hypothetical protein